MKKQHIFSLKLNNYERINPQELLVQSQRWITNGADNMFFNKVENAYLGSTTNTAIIDAFSNYIIGDGLEDINGFDVESILSEEDQRLSITDFKIHGACAFQVIYNVGKKVAELCYIPTKSLAIARQGDITEKPEAYYYSFDWQYKTKYRPELMQAFGYGDGIQSEVLYIKRHSPQPLYALPDWFSGIQFCQTEEEMSNYYIKHISNNFSAGKIININQGIPENDEAQEEAERAIKSQLSGSNNAGDCLISFNENKENATTVDTIEITDAYAQFEFLSTEAEKRIMMSHKVNDPSLFGLPLPTGFNSSAELRIQSLKDLYRNQINPIRKTITKGLEPVFQTLNPNIQLQFTDFEELRVDAPTTPQNMLAVDLNSYTDYPQAATENAKIALRWAEKNGWGDCGTGVGKARANQLANREPISEETIARMSSFERHRQNSDRELGDGCGRLMWLAWGGDEGVEWANRKLDQIRNNQSEVKMDARKVSFDYDGTLTTDMGKHLLELEIAAGKTVYIISARTNVEPIYKLADLYKIPHSRVFATGSNTSKVEKVMSLHIDTHYDNNANVIAKLPNIGKKVN